jgi:uncharacterized membrane protein YdfJ with MMPL/SSD domain
MIFLTILLALFASVVTAAMTVATIVIDGWVAAGGLALLVPP